MSVFLFLNTSCNHVGNSISQIEESIAIIVSVSVSGEENSCNFSVGFSSLDTGCE